MSLLPPSDRDRPVVLVVDDDELVRGFLTRFLARQGCRVRAAWSFDDALSSMDGSVSAAIVDVLLEDRRGRSGIDLLAAIRERGGFDHVPVLICTASAPVPEQLATIRAHGGDLLHKPVSFRELVAWLKQRVTVPTKTMATA